MKTDSSSESLSFQQRVKTIAEAEWEHFDHGQKKECDEGSRQRVGDYWREGVGRNDRDGCSSFKWSAAFISWVMKKAGAEDKFKYDSRHSVYIRDAIQKRKSNDPSVAFKGYRLNEVAPQVGDLVCFSSGENVGDIDYETTDNYDSHCDIVVATRPGEIDVIGGNVQDSVFKKTLPVDAQGHLLVCDPPPYWFVVIQNQFQSSSQSKVRITTYPVTVKRVNNTRKEHCFASEELLAALGLTKGCQIRVKRNDGEYALYTVSNTPSELAENVLLMGRNARSRLGTTDEFAAVVDIQIVHPSFDAATAKGRGEFVERLHDDGVHTGLIAIAPHGGAIERQTDKQAELVVSRLALKQVSGWYCKGWKRQGDEDGKAYDRWHITSTDIHPLSFPCLNTIIDRHFKYAIAFHGFSQDDEEREAEIWIGGLADNELKQEIQQAIQSVVPQNNRVKIASPDHRLSGNDPNNIVNRLSTNSSTPRGNGIQIEQFKAVRESHWQEIAEAVALVYDSKLP